ncbi:alanine dehydrogenase [Rickettsiales bacterium]|nr:alanine dehydrogenase [Rickettsiales bacterium]
MIIGVPKEIKNHEYRVGATPNGVKELTKYGHQVIIEDNAGFEINYTNDDYIKNGAIIAKNAQEVYKKSDIILKVKEPQKSECNLIKEGQVVFSYLHLAAEPELTKSLIKNKSIAIAFETINAVDGSLPLLAPMSEVAGKLSVQAGAKYLEKANGGRGVLLGGVPGVKKGDVTILGGGVAGTNAAKIAIGMGANVTILDKSLSRIRYLCDIFGDKADILYASSQNIEQSVINSDLIIGAVLIPGAAAPKLIKNELLKQMRRGAVIVDISIDQGGCFESSKPTSYSDPSYKIDDIVHYCVTNMPGAVARTSTQALENATLPFTLKLANEGYQNALKNDKFLKNGLNVIDGKITCQAVAKALNYQYHNSDEFI